MFLTNVPMSHPAFLAGRWADRSWLHRATMSLFGNIPTNGMGARYSGGVLYRVEHRIAGGRVLVQSGVRPIAIDVRTIDMSPVLSSLASGDLFKFVLEFNAAKTVNSLSGGARQRRALDRAEIEPWVGNRFSGAASIDALHVEDFRSLRARGGALYVARVVGSGTVQDGVALSHLVAVGVGKGKSFGCGMLSVLPA